MVTKESAYKKIAELVQRFEEQYASYKNSDYNETLTRRDFIDPFFKALGWDVDNEQGYAESFREVIHEDKLKIGNAVKAPDYSFRIGGNKKLFFVEAKKPSVVIKEDMFPAFQVRHYGWNAKLAVSIVTDFEEFAVYDCTKKPNAKDKAAVARINYLTFRDYLKEFDFLWNTFSREAVLKGSFDKYVQGAANKRGTETVDKDFLKTLDGWRTYLANSLSRDNKGLSEEEINFAVQQTIDRIIFLRIAEGRKVEHEGNLQSAVTKGDYYQNLFNIFKEADDKYNSGLFDFKKDALSKNLKIDNKVIKTIISELYYPKSQYEFSELSVEILGSAYEQFLGKVIRITPAHHAKIEEKPEVRKAGGVYYTPEYIVEYIVKHTVGKLIEGKTPKEISKIKIVDPACGSGSFLIGAYNYLLNYHKNYYSNNGKPAKGRKEDTLTPDGHLTTAEKKRILLNNIYGVDIDVNAVEVTKLSLLLKCLEGETEASIAHQLSMFHERVLPTLENNIKSGNSLVSTDIYENELFEVDKKTKPFDWEKEFPEVFVERKEEPDPKEELKRIARQAKAHAEKALEYSTVLSEKLETVFEPQINYTALNKGGFDVVIGNPPYVQSREGQLKEEEKVYYNSHFNTAEYQINTYGLFIEKGIKLLKHNGLLGFIVPNYWLSTDYDKKLRKFIFQENRVTELVNVYKVFDSAVVDTLLLTVTKESSATQQKSLIKSVDRKLKTISERLIDVKANKWAYEKEVIVNTQQDDIEISFQDSIKLKADKTIGDYFDLKFGVKLYQVGKGKPPQKKSHSENKVFETDKKLDSDYIKLLRGRNIQRYYIREEQHFIKYGEHLAEPRNIELFQGARILVQRIVSKNCLDATFTDKELVCNTDVITLKPRFDFNCKFYLGILGSKLLGGFIKSRNINLDRNVFPKINTNTLENVPVPDINKVNATIQKSIINLVDRLLKLNEEKANAKLQSATDEIQRYINFCEDQINIKVYQLYELTADEIKIIEGE